MKRKSPKRIAQKKLLLIDDLQEICDHMAHITPIEVCIKKIAEALIFLLEERCRNLKPRGNQWTTRQRMDR